MTLKQTEQNGNLARYDVHIVENGKLPFFKTKDIKMLELN